MAVKVYGYAKCGTCRKAWKWFRDNDVSFENIPIAEHPPSRQVIVEAWERSGLPLRKFFNTSGKSYREGGFSARLKGGMSEAEQLDALAADGMLVKRPLVLSATGATVGFDAARYAELFLES